MTDDEKEWMIALVEAVESLFAENAALKVTLEHHHVPPEVYNRECRELTEHPDNQNLFHARFADLRAYIEQSPDLSKVLESLARTFPKPDKSN
jgi:hypothetical protein